VGSHVILRLSIRTGRVAILPVRFLLDHVFSPISTWMGGIKGVKLISTRYASTWMRIGVDIYC